MERLPLTLTNIQPHVSSVAYDALSKVCDDSVIGELSSPGGIPAVVQGSPSRVQMDWHTDESDQINGIFLCVYNDSLIQAWKILKDSSDSDFFEITILTKPRMYTGTSTPMLHVTLANQTFERCAGTRHEEDVQFNFAAEHLQNPEQIQDFFKHNQAMLPETLRRSLFPSKVEHKHREPPPKKPSSPSSSNNNNYLYIAGGIFLFLSIAYLAKRAFAKK